MSDQFSETAKRALMNFLNANISPDYINYVDAKYLGGFTEALTTAHLAEVEQAVIKELENLINKHGYKTSLPLATDSDYRKGIVIGTKSFQKGLEDRIAELKADKD